MCEQLPVPQSKRRAEGTLKLSPDGVNDPGLLDVHKAQEACFIVKEDANTIRLAHQCHRNNLIAGHGKPLTLSVAKDPGGAVGAHAVISGHQCLSHTHSKLLGLFDRHLPVMSAAAYLLIAKHNSPISEALGVVLHMTGIQAQHTIDDTSVFLEEIQTAVSSSLIKLELQFYRELKKTNKFIVFLLLMV